MLKTTDINYMSYYSQNPALQDYYATLPRPIRERLDESGVEISTLGELKQVVEHMLEHQV